MSSVRSFNLGLPFFGFKSCVILSVCGQIWQIFLGLMTLDQVKVYQISAYLVHRELRNATFEGEKMPTSIIFPDSALEYA